MLPTFVALLVLTPPTVLFLAAPLLRPAIAGCKLAWEATRTNARTQAYWNWGWSWVVPAGPAARYIVGTLMAWADLDTGDKAYGDLLGINIGMLVLVGLLLALITAVGCAFVRG